MKICITGGAGMIGSALTKNLIDEGFEVLIIDNLWRGKLEYLYDNDEPIINLDKNFFNIDLSNSLNNDKIREIIANCDYVVHLADIVAGIGYVFNNQYDIFSINNKINSNLFSSTRNSNIKKLIYVGTACSFPLELQHGLDAELFDESLFPANPESAYGWSKLIGQLELRYLKEISNFDISTLVLHNVYGPNCEFIGDRTQVIPALINKIIKAEENSTIDVWGSGEQGRAFIYVDDVVNAIKLSLFKSNLPDFMQVGPNYCTSIKQLVEILIKISGKKLNIYFDKSKPEGDKGRYANTEKTFLNIGWKPEINLEDGLTNTYNWILEKNETR